MAFVICNSWAGVSSSLQLALLQGGPVTLVYSIIISTIGYFAVALSLAELASVYPTAGGQYHFASILSPPKIRRALSYSCGLLAMLSWVAIGVSVTIIIAEIVMATVAATNSGFVTKSWHVFLAYQAIALVALLYNILALKRAPWTHNIGCMNQQRKIPFDSTAGRLVANICFWYSLPYSISVSNILHLHSGPVEPQATRLICLGDVH